MTKARMLPVYLVLFGFGAGYGLDIDSSMIAFGCITGMCVSFFGCVLSYLDGKY